MRIHLAALAAASLFVLAGPRPHSEQALVQGIPLGDLMRPKPTAVAQFTPPSSTATPAPMGSTSSATGTSSATPGTTLGTPSSSLGGTNTQGLNLSNPALPSTTPSTSTVGGVPPTTGTPTGGASSTFGGVPSTTGATPPTGTNGNP